MATVGTVGATGNADIDGLLSGYRWNGVLTYSFPDSAGDYGAGYGDGESTATGFAQVSAAQQAVMHSAFEMVAEYTNLAVEYAGTNSADIRIAQSSAANPTAYAYYPGSDEGGDVWFGTSYNYRNPKLGDYYYLTHIHELGHALGLKHSQESGGVANVAVPTGHDALEYTVMSYRSYVGGSMSGGYTNETYGYPTTFMMNDIRALQQMYGADFTTNSGNTVYSWSATTGESFVDGVGQGRPGGATAPAAANVVFMTVWDGDGEDTYDFSNYTTGVTVNLNPGAYSTTSATQIASLGNGQVAHGNVYNAYLYNNDARSYIENVVGGSGGDRLTGNAVANRIDGGAGSDTLTGGAGDDTFVFHSAYGADIVTDYSVGFDQIDFSGWAAYDSFSDIMAVASQAGANTLFNFSIGLSLTLNNVAMTALSAADFFFGTVTGPNEAPTAITIDDLAVAENLAGGVVGSITVTDPDDTVFTFSVSDARFVVSGTPGAYVLKLANGVSLDHEAQPTIDLTVTARDADALSVAQAFTVSVTDAPGVLITGLAGRDIIDAARTVKGQLKPTTEADIINAGSGDDTVYGLAGNDTIDGGAGNDGLYGDAGNDTITGGLGADKQFGGAGNDIFIIADAEAQSDAFSGGDGTDTIQVTGFGSATLARFVATTASIEVWSGNGQAVLGTGSADYLEFNGLQSQSGIAYFDAGAGNDTLSGTRAADDLRGGAGNDVIYGRDGDDRITGGLGVDTLDGGAGDDTFVFGGNEGLVDVLRGGLGTDTVEITGFDAVTLGRFNAAGASVETWSGNGQAVLGTASADNLDFNGLQSQSGSAYFDAGAGNDTLSGTRWADDLRGDAGKDVIYGRDGDDRITGGLGVDTLDGGAGDDTFVFGGNEGLGDILRGGLGTDIVEITGFDGVTLSRFDAVGASVESWHGNDAGVVGTTAADILDFSGLIEIDRLGVIDGGSGNDRLAGTSGADMLRGGIGDDTLTGGLGDDVLTGGAGRDRFVFAAGFGDDIITDFQAGKAAGDILQFSKGLFANLGSVLAASQQVGADVVITASPEDTLTLQNLQLGALHANDFAFI